MNKNGNSKNGRRGKALDLNTKILIEIRDELREHRSILQGHTSILQGHTSILQEHTLILQRHEERLVGLETAVKELAKETRRWVAHFDRDYLRLANEFDSIKLRVEKVEDRMTRRN